MALPSLAATYNVNGSTGSDSNTCTQALSPSTPKATISAGLGCESCADTVVVFAGTYSSGTIPAGTGSGSYNALTINGTDVVNITGAITLNSHTKVSGLVFNHTGSCFSLSGSATDVVVGPNNNLTSCSSFTINNTNSFVYWQGNTWAYAGCVPPNPSQTCGRGINVFGGHVLIENSDFSHCQLCVVVGDATVALTDVIVRNDTFHDQFETENGSNHHSDAVFSEPDAGVTNFLIEGNLQYHTVGVDSKAFLSQNDQSPCSTTCSGLIIRFNTTSRIGGGAITNDKSWPFVVSYNNTWVDTVQDATTQFAGTNNSITAPNAAYLNDIYYYTQSSISDFNPYYCNNTNCSFGHNSYWCTGSCTLIHDHTYGSGNFTSDPGNLNSDPKFVSYIGPGNPANNYHLQAGSPDIASGTFLTTVAAGDSGSGTSLIVNNASFFQDGYGLINANSTVQADCIAVGTSANHVCITAVNYATNTLTLASSISRSSGQGVFLYDKSDGVQVLTGSAPDRGAFPFTSSTPALQLSPSSFNYGNVVLGGSSSIGFTLTNIGGGSATVSTITYTGSNSGDFSTQSQTCGTLPATLGAGASCTINVLFTPGGTGSRSGTLNVTDTPDSISATAGLSGTGIAAAGGASVNGGGTFNGGTIN